MPEATLLVYPDIGYADISKIKISDTQDSTAEKEATRSVLL